MGRILSIISVALFISSFSWAHEEHKLTRIAGSHSIDLKEYDHSVAGQVRDFTVFGDISEATNSSELSMKRDGVLVRAKFELKGSIWGGRVQHQHDDRLVTTEIFFKGLKKETNQLVFSVNGVEAFVSIVSASFVNNHFINPEYTIVYKGEEFKYNIESGQACYKYSALLSFVMLGALLH